ncbi:hypothetical protein C9975_06350 [Thalassospira xiamenensis]|nr:hypothetical protein C9939_02120 [Pseudidiomarina aestuarii]PTC00654.1 hypothetical protein C9975_06350 [Thalassospira xiamenensis]
MPIYHDVDGDSGVEAYETGDDWICVTFSKGQQRSYTYTYAVTGADNVEHMKKLAASGEGLNSFINKNVKYDYAHKK